ncbi:hypothetical protein [Blastomonas sp.]|uniref:FitA-like ribbon-helix-helix domain-containing protein n=1 Tax=Blastomonas sp. TaxID=1909299 RepID=UPI0035940A0A
MASLTVRNVPDDAKLRFRQVAAAHGRSMEEHLRVLICEAGMAAADPSVRDAPIPFKVHPESDPKAESRERIERLIEAGRGIGWEPEPREVGTIKETDFF